MIASKPQRPEEYDPREYSLCLGVFTADLSLTQAVPDSGFMLIIHAWQTYTIPKIVQIDTVYYLWKY